jgi:hypothetical protein
MPWDLLIASAVYSFVAASWRDEARQSGGIAIAWFVAGLASIGSIVLIVLIGIKVSWWTALLCVLASFVGQIVLIPLDRAARTVVGLWVGIAVSLVAAGYIIHRVFST